MRLRICVAATLIVGLFASSAQAHSNDSMTDFILGQRFYNMTTDPLGDGYFHTPNTFADDSTKYVLYDETVGGTCPWTGDMHADVQGLDEDKQPITGKWFSNSSGKSPAWCQNLLPGGSGNGVHNALLFDHADVGEAPAFIKLRVWMDADNDWVVDSEDRIMHTSVTPVDAPREQSFGDPEFGIDPTADQGDPVNSATGSFTTKVTDLSLDAPSLPFVFTRSYNSLDTNTTGLGRGWTHSYNISLTITAAGNVFLRGGTGQKVFFRKLSDGTYRPDAGVTAALVKTATGYEVTKTDQTKYTFNSTGKLTKWS